MPVLVYGLAMLNGWADTRYVDVNSATPTPPFTNWATASTTIQEAIDIADPGDQILVTNGVYQTGGRTGPDVLTNRVVVGKLLTVQSVNGPAVTTIVGYQLPGATNGDAAVRCVYLTNDAVLIGFTLTGGGTRTNNSLTGFNCGGGLFCGSAGSVASNCWLIGNSARFGAAVCSGTLYDCILSNNVTAAPSFTDGGGAYQSTLVRCTLGGNHADGGGGAYSSVLIGCRVIGNFATSFGGGIDFGAATNCLLAGNVCSTNGGGAYSATLDNCTLTANSATFGGGALNGYFNNCIAWYNTAASGSNYSSVTVNYSCTAPLPPVGSNNLTTEPQLTDAFHLSAGSPCRGAGSSAYVSGVDLDGEAWNNPPSMGCDEYYPGAVTGPLSVAIQASSPGVATGLTLSFSAQIDGRATLHTWDFGDGTTATNQPYPSHFWSTAGDYPLVLTAFNDSNPGGVSATVIVHVVNSPVHHVALDSINPVSPYLSWDTAATNIQDAIDALYPGGMVLVSNGVYQTGARVMSGGASNRVAIMKPILVQSVNGPAVTVIQGYQVPATTNGSAAVRCVYLANNATLSGFTLRGGATIQTTGFSIGGGVLCDSTNVVVTNCVMTGNCSYTSGAGAYSGTFFDCQFLSNSAFVHSVGGGGGCYGGTLVRCMVIGNHSSDGAGLHTGRASDCLFTANAGSLGAAAYISTLDRCLIISNSATGGGRSGGADTSTLNNCLVSGNTAQTAGGTFNSSLTNCTIVGNFAASSGGGANGGTLQNCIIYNNSAPSGSNYSGGSLSYCCTQPLPAAGKGNMTNNPLFINFISGDFHLQSNSPCINSGNNPSVPASVDLDGNPRNVGGTLDIGAYEFQTPASIISYAWLLQYGLPLDGSVDLIDSDADGMNNWQEWIAGTVPTNAVSVLRLLNPTNTLSSPIIKWQSVSGVTYYLQRSSNLAAPQPFSALQSNIVGQAGSTSYTDTSATGPGPFFYRVGVQ
jgi:parallel beta-helix repeat protein